MSTLPPRYVCRRPLAEGAGMGAYRVTDVESGREGVLVTPSPALPEALDAGTLADGRPYVVVTAEAAPAALAAPVELAPDPIVRAQALRFQGTALVALGRLEAGRAAFEAEAELEARPGAESDLAATWLGLGFLAIERGDVAAAEAWAQQVRSLPEGLSGGFPAAFAQVLAGKARVFAGDAAGVAGLLAGVEAVGALRSPAAVLGALGHATEAMVRLGRWQEAADNVAKARALARLTGTEDADGRFARLEAAIAVGTDAPEAGERARGAVAAARADGNPVALAQALRWLGAWQAQHAPAEAAASLAEAHALAAEAGHGALVAELAAGRPAPAPRLDADRHALLTDLVVAINTEADLPGVLRRTLAAFVQVAGAERGFLLLYEGYQVVQEAYFGMTEADSDAYSSSLAYQVLWSGEPVFIEDAQAHAELAQQDSIQALGLRSVLGVPLFNGEDVIGVMLADSQRINVGFGEADMALAMALARQAAIAIMNVRRLEAYRQSCDELTILHRLALAATRAASLEALMAHVAREAAALAGAERVVLLEGEALACRIAYNDGGERLEGERAAVSTTVARWVYEHGKPLHLLDAQNEEGFSMQQSVMALGLRTIEAVPVIDGDRTLGVLYTDNQRVVETPANALRTLARMADVVAAYLARDTDRCT